MALTAEQVRTGALYDEDPSWQSFTGTVRVRNNSTYGALELQVSHDNGDGTFNVSTFVLTGSFKDSRPSATQWPAGQN
jgi:hypothetical protein